MGKRNQRESNSLSSNPLFSSIVTLYSLLLLYVPTTYLTVIFSAVLIATAILLMTLLQLGSIQRAGTENDCTGTKEIEPPGEDHKWVGSRSESKAGFDPNMFHSESFVEWNVRAPLEVIYEEYEGERNDDVSREKHETRFPSLSAYHPESDTDSSSDGDFPAIDGWDSPENMCFRWDEVEDREGLIEIALDGNKKISEFQVDEENLIEIDISPGRISGEWNGAFSGEFRFN